MFCSFEPSYKQEIFDDGFSSQVLWIDIMFTFGSWCETVGLMNALAYRVLFEDAQVLPLDGCISRSPVYQRDYNLRPLWGRDLPRLQDWSIATEPINQADPPKTNFLAFHWWINYIWVAVFYRPRNKLVLPFKLRLKRRVWRSWNPWQEKRGSLISMGDRRQWFLRTGSPSGDAPTDWNSRLHRSDPVER